MSSTNAVYPLRQIYFYLTSGCNLNCRHCWMEPEFQGISQEFTAIDPATFKFVIDQALPLGLTGIKLTGGEPLMHPDFAEILSILRRYNISISIETNGILCSSDMARQIRSSGNRLFVSVSLDGVDATTHEWIRGVKGAFDTTIAGIVNMVKVGIKPQIIMSIMRRNKYQVEDIVSLAKRIGASSVKFNPVQPTARGNQMHESLETLSVNELVELGREVTNVFAPSAGIPLHFTQPLAFRPLGAMLDTQSISCGVCGVKTILGVLSNSSYSLCGIGESVPDLVFGSCSTDRLTDIWLKSELLLRLRDGLPNRLEGICSECVMKAICNGSCIAQNYYRSRNLWAPFWFCEEANRLGVFPESRRWSYK